MLLKDLLVYEETKSAAVHPHTETLSKLIHDIRNPLGAILTTNRMLASGVSDESLFKFIELQDVACREIKELLRVAAETLPAKANWLKKT